MRDVEERRSAGLDDGLVAFWWYLSKYEATVGYAVVYAIASEKVKSKEENEYVKKGARK